ncbi:MAG: PP2C family serine/threonine-protein phosphatase [Steroidobacteraceae bacterium]
MLIEYADLSLIGAREDNQDRVAIAVSEHAALLVVIDGMGGHADGAKAADTALKSMLDSFWQSALPIFDPLGFVHLALGRAHDEVCRLGNGLTVDSRPRATTAICLVQDGSAYWGHVGDSRIYLMRRGQVADRTRDHSHVELLLREKKITQEEVAHHPMRNFVESCLGGDPAVPEMTISGRKSLIPGDVLMLCTDGIWSNLSDSTIAGYCTDESQDLRSALEVLGHRAVAASAPFSDNSTAAILRWKGE